MKYFLSFSLLLFLICSPAVISYGQDIASKDGVRIIHNKKPLWGKSPKVQLEKIRTMGDIDTTDEHVAFYMPLDMALDEEGNLYVLDSGNHRIQKFSPEGEYLSTIGRQGQGPGEFHFPTSLDIDKNDTLFVCSQFSKKIQVLDTSGKELESLVVTEDFSRYVRTLGTDRLLTAAVRGFMSAEEKKDKPDPLFQIMDRQGKIQGTFGEPENFKDELLNSSGNSIFFSVGPDDFIYSSFQNRNRIEKYSPDGRIIWRADRPLKFKTEKPLFKGKIERFKGGGISVEGARWNRCSEAVGADSKGRVWVITLARQLKEEEEAGTSTRMSRTNRGAEISMRPNFSGEVSETDAYELEVFDPEGSLLYSYPLDHFADIIRFHGDQLYIMDRLRRMQVHVYRLVENF